MPRWLPQVGATCRHWRTVHDAGGTLKGLDLRLSSPCFYQLLDRAAHSGLVTAPADGDAIDLTHAGGGSSGELRWRPSQLPSPLVQYAELLVAKPARLSRLCGLALIMRDDRVAGAPLEPTLPRALAIELLRATGRLDWLSIADSSSIGSDGMVAIIQSCPSLRSCCLSVDIADHDQLHHLGRLRTVTEMTLQLKFPPFEIWNREEDSGRSEKLAECVQDAIASLPNLRRLTLHGATHGYSMEVPISLASESLRFLSVETRKSSLKVMISVRSSPWRHPSAIPIAATLTPAPRVLLLRTNSCRCSRSCCCPTRW